MTKASLPKEEKVCAQCGKSLPIGRRRYCRDQCAYIFNSIKNERHRKLSVAQHLRMMRAGRKQRMGKIVVRFN